MPRMSPDQPQDPTSSRPSDPRPPSARETGSRGGGVAWALLLSLFALLGAGYVGWRQWQQGREATLASTHLAALDARLKTLEHGLEDRGAEGADTRDRLLRLEQAVQPLRESLSSQETRLRNLEDAVARLAQKSLSAHDTLLLDEAESLLRLGEQRYALFHDAQGAATAYALADQALAAINDGAYSGVRRSLAAERQALLASRPADLETGVATLGRLRESVATWPLKPALPADKGGHDEGAWARLLHALGGVISVRRDDGTPLAATDTTLARELVALDLAQAQAALLAHDTPGAAAALRRVAAALARFDDADPGVQAAREAVTALLAQLAPAPPVRLGGALAELRNLRAVHALQQAAPAPAASTGTPP